MTHETIEQRAKRLVEQNMQACMSGIVHTLAKGMAAPREVIDLCDQAVDLASPVPDYEEAAIQAGWKRVGDGATVAGREWRFIQTLDLDGTTGNTFADNWQELCEVEDIEPYDREVYEHWAVSDYMAELLQAVGEKVDTDFGGLNVWARTTTGQMICMDSCIEACVREQERRYEAAIASLPPLPANAAPVVLY